jgi:hypothetical protein
LVAATHAAKSYTQQRELEPDKDYYIYYRTPLGNQIYPDIQVSNIAERTKNGYCFHGIDEFELVTPRKIPSTLQNEAVFEYVRDILKNHLHSVNPDINYDFTEKPYGIEPALKMDNNKPIHKNAAKKKSVSNDDDFGR